MQDADDPKPERTDWPEFKARRRAERAARRGRAEMDFPDARVLAFENGLTLAKIAEGHYQLRPQGAKGFIINLHPGSGRIRSDANRRGPYLDLKGRPWILPDVVLAAVAAIAKGT